MADSWVVSAEHRLAHDRWESSVKDLMSCDVAMCYRRKVT